MTTPNQENVDWSAVCEAVADAIADGEGSPGEEDLRRAFTQAGILIAHEGTDATAPIEVGRTILYQIAAPRAKLPYGHDEAASLRNEIELAARRIAEATALGGEVHIVAK